LPNQEVFFRISLECPYCKTYTPALKAWIQQQQDVNLQWHHLPLAFHGPAAIHEARLIEYAAKMGGTHAFWQAIDQTFAHTRSNGQGLTRQMDINGISNHDLEDCATNNTAIAQNVSRQAEEAIKAGITATPSVLIEDNTTGRTIKIEGPADNMFILSAIDRLARSKGKKSKAQSCDFSPSRAHEQGLWMRYPISFPCEQ
jgi:protein-disulfide isomerase